MENNKKPKFTNPMSAPQINKIILNVGTGKIRENRDEIKIISENLKLISGQKPRVTRARKAISGFKVRKNDEIGLKVTLRRQRMNDFAFKLANIVLPRLRDFRGLNPDGFDKAGNYTLGIAEQISFPEISAEKQEASGGLSVTFVTTAENRDSARQLMESLGFPFRKK